MSNLLQSQIKESCKLALPDGLKELMSDISREVLRAQPANLIDFITKYLAALLVTRENLSIGYRLCQDVSDSCCLPELKDELKKTGLGKEDAAKAKDIIEKYFKKGKVNEGNLMMKLMRKISISEHQLELVRDAIQNAFLQHQINKADETAIPEMPPNGDAVSRAAIHTLQLYAETGPSEEEYNQKASRIQAAYRAYGVRRLCKSKTTQERTLKNLRFCAQTNSGAEVDISSETSNSDMSISSSSLYYDSSKYKETDERSSHRNLTEISEPDNAQPRIDYDIKRKQLYLSKQNKLRFKEDKKINISSEHDTPSFEASGMNFSSVLYDMQYEKPHEKPLFNSIFMIDGNSHHNDEIFSLAKLNFRDFSEISSNEAIYEACDLISQTHEVNVDDVIVEEAETVDDNALDANNDSDVTLEDIFGENKGNTE